MSEVINLISTDDYTTKRKIMDNKILLGSCNFLELKKFIDEIIRRQYVFSFQETLITVSYNDILNVYGYKGLESTANKSNNEAIKKCASNYMNMHS